MIYQNLKGRNLNTRQRLEIEKETQLRELEIQQLEEEDRGQLVAAAL